jgi:integrase
MSASAARSPFIVGGGGVRRPAIGTGCSSRNGSHAWRQAAADSAATKSGGPIASGRTITEVIEPYWIFAQGYYVKNGQPTREVGCLRMALRVWRQHYGDIPAVEFDSLKMLALQEIMIGTGWSRKTINDSLARVKRALKWMVSRKLIPAAVMHECSAVTGLEKGRSRAKETEPKRPVPEEHIEAVRPWVSRQVWALIQLQLLTGARPGEVLRLRKRNIDRRGRVWTAMLDGHKTEHHGHERRLYFGPEAQALLAPFLVRPDDAFLFSPEEAERERRAAMHDARVTPEGYGNGIGTNRKPRPRRMPGELYGRDSYRVAIRRACDKANSWAKGGHIIDGGERLVPRGPNPSTAFRWIKYGVWVGNQRVHLEHGWIGGRLFTSAEAVDRFIERCTAKDGQVRTLGERRRNHERAAKRLSAEGL